MCVNVCTHYVGKKISGKIDIMYNDFAAAQNRMCRILRDVIVYRVLLFTDRNKQSMNIML